MAGIVRDSFLSEVLDLYEAAQIEAGLSPDTGDVVVIYDPVTHRVNLSPDCDTETIIRCDSRESAVRLAARELMRWRARPRGVH